jgi:hypothetical protein
VDRTRNQLYVGVAPSESRIIVFNNANTVDTTGGPPLAPNRTLTFTSGLGSFFLDDVNDRLYVAQFNGTILVFDNASMLTTGTPSFSRTFTLGNTQKYIFVDTTNDRLYGVSENVVFIIPNASTANGLGVTGTVLQVQTTGSLFSAVAAKP